ncbi:MAG TPA: hypothetical protein VKU89_10975 [Solirubrobacteraceae bacterium]|nr:hypothetical protein [Solirubrobacteraceae bacterium]
MPESNLHAREELLESLRGSIDHLAGALALLGEAYDHLDEQQADALESSLFKPLQRGYGRAKRAVIEFAARHDQSPPQLGQPPAPLPATGVKALVEGALAEVEEAENGIVTLQDSLVLLDLGDQELRARLAEVRQALEEARGGARHFLRTLGR